MLAVARIVEVEQVQTKKVVNFLHIAKIQPRPIDHGFAAERQTQEFQLAWVECAWECQKTKARWATGFPQAQI